MKPYLIKFWHGTPHEKTRFMQKCVSLFRRRDADDTYFWDGTLQEFVDKWKDKFIYIHPTDDDAAYLSGIICITPYGTFGQR